MNDAVIGFGGVLLGCTLSILLAHFSRARDAKDQFRVFISIKRGNIPSERFFEFYNSTRSEIRDAISRLQPFLGNGKRLDIEGWWSRYSALTRENLHDDHERESEAFLYEAFGEIPPKKPSYILRWYFDKMARVAK